MDCSMVEEKSKEKRKIYGETIELIDNYFFDIFQAGRMQGNGKKTQGVVWTDMLAANKPQASSSRSEWP